MQPQCYQIRESEAASRGLAPGYSHAERIDVIRRALRMACRREHGPRIVLEHFEPRGDIGRVVVPYFWRQCQIGAQERRAKLGALS